MADEVEPIEVQKWRNIVFNGKQLLAIDSNHFYNEDMTESINLYLRSRNSYRAFREILVLPCRNAICDYFGKQGLSGSAQKCERTVRKVFFALNEGQKDCFITFDEIHVKPGLQYQCPKYYRTKTCQQNSRYHD